VTAIYDRGMVARRVATALIVLLTLFVPAAAEICSLCAGCPVNTREPAPACHEDSGASLTSACCAGATAAEPAVLDAVAATPGQLGMQPAIELGRAFEAVTVHLAAMPPALPGPAAVPLFTLHSALLI
jgi:hypothetical protein